ncbi:uncharacterized protein RMCC_5815 [Mycolicibacterium canariasense]|uniref:ParB/Sulfiredoxin domain-containing protein n=1 Tax=Mycolicibacterium canariasense TaxID=228230 RepID=A0A117IC12_MYCCR|nr:DUF6551 family protein [Mycolicibacterium canariasense]MCV7210192.1 hypothetical protein [Mycolicibacterium canariasense]ORU98464.1 hypothetical protein AWB94_28380 [Mycolicibacterium canariasense]GAS98850.1 uncharacterized protein RMCC_5815 [Mycolicibacterium canariasense]
MTASSDVYVTVLDPSEIFADPTYQRLLDTTHARKMSAGWDRRLAGIIEVSDRGEGASPRYAVIDGQHRWAAARNLTEPPKLVANVHEGLTVEQEAQLFDKLNRQRKKINGFDHYRARLAAGEWIIVRVQAVLDKHHLKMDPAPNEGNVGCVGTLEKVAEIDDALLDEVLGLIIGIWGRRREGFDAPIIHGLALILHKLRDDVDLERLVDALLDVMPRQLSTQAVALRDMQSGTLPVLTALVIMGLYNKKPGRKIEVSNRTFGIGKGGNNQRKGAAS